ncbi:MAG: PAS domain S-box protein [Candidatus Hodarchaeales archaeon]
MGIVKKSSDISEREQATEEIRSLKESESRNRQIIENIREIIFTLSPEGNVTSLNPAFEKITGWSPNEFLDKPFTTMIHPDDVPVALRAFNSISLSQIPSSPSEVRLKTKTGTYSFIEGKMTPQFEQGKIIGFFGIARDITECKQIEKELRESEQKFKDLINLLPQTVFESDLEGNITFVNQHFHQKSSYSQEEIDKGLKAPQLVIPEDRDRVKQNFTKSLNCKKTKNYEYSALNKDGTTYPIVIFSNPIVRENTTVGLRGIVFDISDVKKAKDEITKTKMRLEYLLESCPAVIYSCTPYGNFATTFMSKNIKKVLGYQAMDFNNRPDFWEGKIHPNDRERVIDALEEISEKGIVNITYRFKHKNGSYRWMLEEANLIHDDKGNPLEIVGFWTDITERKQAQDALRDREEIFRLLSEQSFMAISLIQNDRIKYVNQAFVDLVEFSEEEVLSWTSTEYLQFVLRCVHPDDLAFVREQGLKKQTGKTDGVVPNYTFRLITQTGQMKWIEVYSKTINFQGSPADFVSFIDITERKETEEKLRKIEANNRYILENVRDVIFTLSPKGKVISLSPEFEKITGWTCEEWIGKSFTEISTPEDISIAIEGFEATIRGESPPPYEGRIISKSGEILTLEVKATPQIKDSKIIGFLGTARDITLRKKAEEALKESEEALRDKEERLRHFMDAATDSFTLWDSELKLVDINNMGLKTFFKEKNSDNIIGRNILDFAGSSSYIEIFKDVLETGKPFSGEKKTPHSLFGDLFLSVKAFKVGDGLGIITTDVTARKQIEDELKENEEKFRSIFENAPIGMALTDLDFRFIKINTVFCQMMGYSAHELAQLSFPDITHPDYHRKDIEYNKKLIQDEISTYQTEKRFLMKDENFFWGRTTVSLLCTDKKAPSYFLAMIEDITALKQKEEEIKSQLLKYNLIDGNMYLIKGNIPKSQTVFNDLLNVGYSGFIISRTPEREHRQYIEGDFNILHLTEKSNSEEIHKFIENAPHKSAFLIDRLDYLFTKKGFDDAIQFVYKWSDISYLNNLIILLSVDVSTLSDIQLSILEKETKKIEPRFLARISEELLEILRFVYQQNNLGLKPSYSDTSKELQTSRPTVRKRITNLVTTGYLIDPRKGNKKVLEITEKGRSLFLR